MSTWVAWALLLPPPSLLCVFVWGRTEEAVRAGGKHFAQYGFRQWSLAGLPTEGLPDLIVISLATAATMSIVSHQHIKPPGRQYPRANTRERKKKKPRKTYIYAHACVNTETHTLAEFSHSRSHIPTLLPSSRAFFPPVGLWWAEGAEQDFFWVFPLLPVLERQSCKGGHGIGRGVKTIGSALIYGTGFDGLSLLLTINS